MALSRELAAPLLLGLAGAGLLGAVLPAQGREETAPLRTAVLKTYVVAGLLVVLSIEGLSSLHVLRPSTLATFWGLVAATGLGRVLAGRRNSGRLGRELLASRAAAVRELPLDARLALLTSGVFLALSLVTALATPPNNWDSMTYHMARVAHWLANESVGYYPAINIAQLIMPPFGGFAIATVQALAGSEVWANTVQWLAYLGGAVAVSHVVHGIGGSLRAQVFAALAFLTLPMAALQAATTQTDLLTALWVVVALAFVSSNVPGRSLWVAAALGLGVLTKPTLVFFGLPIASVHLARLWLEGGPARRRLRRCVAAAAVLAAVGVALIGPYAVRNLHAFGSAFLAGSKEVRTRNEAIGPRSFLSNVLRDVALHLPLPGYGEAVIRLHGALGIDPDDPRTTRLWDDTFTNVSRVWMHPLVPNEDSAGNPVHLAAGALLLAVALACRRRLDAPARAAMTVGAAGAAGWLLVLVPFKWQPWSARFDLPFFAVLAVPLGVAMARLGFRYGRALALACVLGALPALLMATRRPLVNLAVSCSWPLVVWLVVGALIVLTAVGAPGRWPLSRRLAAGMLLAGALPLGVRLGARVQTMHPFPPASVLTASRIDMRFRGRPMLAEPYLRAVAMVRSSGCPVVGLTLKRDDWEYPLWELLGAASGPGPIRVRTLAVDNESATLAAEAADPCLVISSRGRRGLARESWRRHPISSRPPLVIYTREVRAAA